MTRSLRPRKPPAKKNSRKTSRRLPTATRTPLKSAKRAAEKESPAAALTVVPSSAVKGTPGRLRVSLSGPGPSEGQPKSDDVQEKRDVHEENGDLSDAGISHTSPATSPANRSCDHAAASKDAERIPPADMSHSGPAAAKLDTGHARPPVIAAAADKGGHSDGEIHGHHAEHGTNSSKEMTEQPNKADVLDSQYPFSAIDSVELLEHLEELDNVAHAAMHATELRRRVQQLEDENTHLSNQLTRRTDQCKELVDAINEIYSLLELPDTVPAS